MASKKKLKKSINNLTYELISECLTFKHFHPEVESEKIDAVMHKILETRNDLVARISNPDGKGNVKINRQHYNSIQQDMNLMVDAMDELGKLAK
ncbi:MAG TPA: hypothetical protein VE912_05455 [Bacteroidales bacterium]|nr:hypothetical protein [Bacteroidales bacterium]